MDINVLWVDFRTLTDQIYKFEEKWVSSGVSYVMDRFATRVYASDGCKRITSRF